MTMTLEQRIARAERRVRQLGTVLALMTVLLLGTITIGAHGTGWFVNEAGRATFGQPAHMTGATVDIMGLPDDAAGLTILDQSGTIDQGGHESFLMLMKRHPTTTYWSKMLSISGLWDAANPTDGSGSAVARYNAGYTLWDGTQRDSIHAADYGLGGWVFCPANPNNWTYGERTAETPQLVVDCGIVRFLHDIVITGDIKDEHGNVLVYGGP